MRDLIEYVRAAFGLDVTAPASLSLGGRGAIEEAACAIRTRLWSSISAYVMSEDAL